MTKAKKPTESPFPKIPEELKQPIIEALKEATGAHTTDPVHYARYFEAINQKIRYDDDFIGELQAAKDHRGKLIAQLRGVINDVNRQEEQTLRSNTQNVLVTRDLANQGYQFKG